MLRQPSELEIVFGAVSLAALGASIAYVLCWSAWDMTAEGAFWVSLIAGVVVYELQLLMLIPESGDTR